jgi:nucleotide-binding universal stress UspA family protein
VVRALHVVDVDVALGFEAALPAYPRAIRDGLLDDARTAWAAFARAIPGADRVPFEAVLDALVLGITRRAREAQADLVVLGAFGAQRPDLGFGTAATACVRHAHCDVLLIRDTQTAPFRRVVAAVDLSEGSRRALERAVEVASKESAELVVLHVYAAPWRDLNYRAAAMLVEPELQARYLHDLQARVRDFAAPVVKDLPAARVRHVVEDAATHRMGIPEVCEREKAELVVLGTRGRTNLRDVLLGSTAEKTLKRARIRAGRALELTRATPRVSRFRRGARPRRTGGGAAVARGRSRRRAAAGRAARTTTRESARASRAARGIRRARSSARRRSRRGDATRATPGRSRGAPPRRARSPSGAP